MFFIPQLIVMEDLWHMLKHARGIELKFEEVDFTRNQLEDICYVYSMLYTVF